MRLFFCIVNKPNLLFRTNSLPVETVEKTAEIIIVKRLIQGCNYEDWVRVETKTSDHVRCISLRHCLEQGCATHGPRATIRPSRPVNVALDDGRTKIFFF